MKFSGCRLDGVPEKVFNKSLFSAPMKFAWLFINMSFIGQAETQRTQEKISTLCPLPASPVLLNRAPSGCSTEVSLR
jgi:hypothetical protein